MTVKVSEGTIGIWLVAKDGSGGGTFITVIDKEDGHYVLRVYKNGELSDVDRNILHNDTESKAIKTVRNGVKAAMEKFDTDRAWEAIRGARSMEEYMRVLRGLPGLKEKLPSTEEKQSC